jgi:hypothetical protein
MTVALQCQRRRKSGDAGTDDRDSHSLIFVTSSM